MNFIIVGSSAGVGRALSDELARRGHDLLLIASDERDIFLQSKDLTLKHSIRALYHPCHIVPGGGFIDGIVEKARELGTVDGLFFPMGYVDPEDTGTIDREGAASLVEVNFLSIATITTAFLPEMRKRAKGYINGFGSIASIRGRGSNVIYASAKRALLSYFESLRHLTSGDGIIVNFYQVGYVETQNSFGRELLFPKATPEKVARVVCDSLFKDRGTIYIPGFWRFISIIVKLLPWRIFKRLDF